MSNKNIIAILLAAILILGIGLWFLLQEGGFSSGLGDKNMEGMTGSGEAKVYYFWGQGAPVSVTAKEFLQELEEQYSGLEVKTFETWQNQENLEMLKELNRAYGVESKSVPAMFIGEERMSGFSQKNRDDIREKIEFCLEEVCLDPGSRL